MFPRICFIFLFCYALFLYCLMIRLGTSDIRVCRLLYLVSHVAVLCSHPPPTPLHSGFFMHYVVAVSFYFSNLLGNFRLPLRCSSGLRSSGMLGCVNSQNNDGLRVSFFKIYLCLCFFFHTHSQPISNDVPSHLSHFLRLSLLPEGQLVHLTYPLSLLQTTGVIKYTDSRHGFFYIRLASYRVGQNTYTVFFFLRVL